MAEAVEQEVGGGDLSIEDAKALIADGAQLVDVRRPYEWEAGRISGAVWIEVNELPARSREIDKSKPVVFYCRGGSRSALAAEAFREAGYDAHSIESGLRAWAAAGEELEPEGGTVAEAQPGIQ